MIQTMAERMRVENALRELLEDHTAADLIEVMHDLETYEVDEWISDRVAEAA
jgi:hypothetical protein